MLVGVILVVVLVDHLEVIKVVAVVVPVMLDIMHLALMVPQVVGSTFFYYRN